MEVAGTALTFTLMPLAWFWLSKQAGSATGSLSISLAVVFFGFIASMVFIVRLLQRVDLVWIELRQRSGYRQGEGALTRVVVGAVTLALLAFYAWYYLLSDAYLLPFMPTT